MHNSIMHTQETPPEMPPKRADGMGFNNSGGSNVFDENRFELKYYT